ncbi:hypothetical protein LINPERHAP1_LOCUS36748, partial [Linum perenne]
VGIFGRGGRGRVGLGKGGRGRARVGRGGRGRYGRGRVGFGRVGMLGRGGRVGSGGNCKSWRAAIPTSILENKTTRIRGKKMHNDLEDAMLRCCLC